MCLSFVTVERSGEYVSLFLNFKLARGFSDYFFFFFFNDTATTEIYTLSLHDALPIWRCRNENRGSIKSGVLPQRGKGSIKTRGAAATKAVQFKKWGAAARRNWQYKKPGRCRDRKSTRLNSSHPSRSRMPSSA